MGVWQGICHSNTAEASLDWLLSRGWDIVILYGRIVLHWGLTKHVLNPLGDVRFQWSAYLRSILSGWTIKGNVGLKGIHSSRDWPLCWRLPRRFGWFCWKDLGPASKLLFDCGFFLWINLSASFWNYWITMTNGIETRLEVSKVNILSKVFFIQTFFWLEKKLTINAHLL